MELTPEKFKFIGSFNRKFATAFVYKQFLKMLNDPAIDLENLKTYVKLQSLRIGSLCEDNRKKYEETFFEIQEIIKKEEIDKSGRL